MSRTPSNVAAAAGNATAAPAAPAAHYITKDDQRKLIAQDAELALVLLAIGDAKIAAKMAGKDYGFTDVNTQFAAKFPAPKSHYSRGKKKGQPRKAKEIDAEKANPAAALFRRVKVRYNSSNLLGTIQKLDQSLGGSSTRQATVELDGGPIETSEL